MMTRREFAAGASAALALTSSAKSYSQVMGSNGSPEHCDLSD